MSVRVDDVDLRDALQRIAGQAGAQIKVAPDVEARVTAELHDVLFEVALENLLSAAETWQALSYYKKDGVYIIEAMRLQEPEVRARVYLGARAAPGPVIRGADDYRLPEQLVWDRRAGRIVAVGTLVDDTPCSGWASGGNGYAAAWAMGGASIGQWQFRGSIHVATPLFRRAGQVSALGARLVRTTGEIADYEWYLLTVPAGRGQELHLEQTRDSPPVRTPTQVRRDTRLRKIATQVGWLPTTTSQAGGAAARDWLTVCPGNVANRVAMNKDLSVVVLAHEDMDGSQDCLAVRQADGRYRRTRLAGLLARVAKGEMRMYAACAEVDRVALGVYAGKASRPLVVCLRVGKCGAKVVAVKRGLLASPVPEL